MNELTHMVLEGMFAILLAGFGLYIKSVSSEVKDLRGQCSSLKDNLADFKLQAEKDFVKHDGLAWIEQKLEKFEKILDEIRLTMAAHRRTDEERPAK